MRAAPGPTASAVEMISLEDIGKAADLLARFAEALTEDVEFTP